MMKESLCEINNLGLRYHRGESAILQGLSLSLFKGEIVGIRGENGAGKSSLLKAIAGLLPYQEGEIRMPKEVRKGLSYLPQDLSLYDSLTALENLIFYGKIQGIPGRLLKTRGNWLLEELGLSQKSREKLSALSGGMKRRVHLASALMLRPSILLLDEPTVGCDEESYHRIRDLLLKMKQQGTGMLLISHGRGELEDLADRILTLEQGKPREKCISSD